jgi:hypothetical protein
MRLKIWCILLSVGFLSAAHAQRLSSAITINVPTAGRIQFEQNYYSPLNTFRVYMVNDPSSSKQIQGRTSLFGLGKWYANSGIGLGYLLKVDYKRVAIRAGYRMDFNHTKIKLNQLNEYGDPGVDKYPVEFKIESFHHKIPLFVSLDLQRKNNSPYLIMGAEYGFMFAKIESVDWDNDGFYDRYKIPFLYGHYYDNSAYLYGLTGVGIKKNRFEWMLCFKTRVDNQKSTLTINEYLLDFNMNIYIAQKSLRTKHYLYIDE